MNRINPYKDLRSVLLSVSKPGQYVGGEFGIRTYSADQSLKIALCFPDLYEIGMSNNAIKILYNYLNNIEGVQCERVFAPAPDFEKVLKDNDISLYSLESGIPLNDFDIIGFSVGYELSITNILTVLELGKVPLYNAKRDLNNPIIIAGGPALTNPLPFSQFIDAIFIGEGEKQFNAIFPDLVSLKESGEDREVLLRRIIRDKTVWNEYKNETVERAIWSDFGKDFDLNSMMPIPTIETVQEHGVIEIMRGCPNGCRFCHAGYFYRPLRQKDYETIIKEAEHIVNDCGYRKITLSSLSTGDYKNLLPLVQNLNKRFKNRSVSFQLPSLRVNSVTLPLLAEISEVRKSSLTFAVETPREDWQRGMNKEVPKDKIIEILKEAKEQGWKLAKFYFMIGLPTAKGEDEIQPIIDFLLEIQETVKIKINVNVGTFIPKPHTPFQWAAQFTDEFAMIQIRRLRDALKGKNFKVGFHSPFVSFVEGILARGDARVAGLVKRAWDKGARLDAWDEYFSRDLWRDVIEEADWDVEQEICSTKDPNSELPWDNVSIGVGKEQFKKEYERALNQDLTETCDNPCKDFCGVCNKEDKVRHPENPSFLDEDIPLIEEVGEIRRILFNFSKKDSAIFLGHLNVMHMFEMAFQRAGFAMKFSKGFNPKPKIEFPHPLTLGIESEGEIVGAEFYYHGENLDQMINTLNKAMPNGFLINSVLMEEPIEVGRKYKSLMSMYWGSKYELEINNTCELTLSKLFDDLKNKISDFEVSCDYQIELMDDSIILRSHMNNKKMNNIMRILEEIVGEKPLSKGINLKRISTYKKNNNTYCDFI